MSFESALRNAYSRTEAYYRKRENASDIPYDDITAYKYEGQFVLSTPRGILSNFLQQFKDAQDDKAVYEISALRDWTYHGYARKQPEKIVGTGLMDVSKRDCLFCLMPANDKVGSMAYLLRYAALRGWRVGYGTKKHDFYESVVFASIRDKTDLLVAASLSKIMFVEHDNLFDLSDACSIEEVYWYTPDGWRIPELSADGKALSEGGVHVFNS